MRQARRVTGFDGEMMDVIALYASGPLSGRQTVRQDRARRASRKKRTARLLYCSLHSALRLRSVGVKKGSYREFLFVCFCVLGSRFLRQRVRVLWFRVGLTCRTGNNRLELQAAVILLFYDSASLRATETVLCLTTLCLAKWAMREMF